MSENMVTETREVDGFDGVTLGAFGNVHITQGDRMGLTIEAPEELMKRVTAEVRDGVLVLDIRRGGWFAGMRQKRQSIRYEVTMTRVRTLRLSGVGRIDAPSIEAEDLSVGVSGVGAIEIGSLRAKSLEVSVSGAGNCEISGQVETQEIRLSGSGNYLARDLESRTASALVSGAGDVTVHVLDTLDAKISGAGSIRYHGAPTVRQRVTGVGSVSCIRSE